MPKIDWGSVEETESAGGVDTLPSGAYECVITAASYKRAKNSNNLMLELVWDVAEGPKKGFFSTDFFANKPFRHCDRLMLEGGGLGFSKHKMRCLADWNPNFNPSAAIDRDETQPFVGKRCVLLLQERKYTYNGRDQSEVNVVGWIDRERYQSHDYEVPETRDERQTGAAAPVAAIPAPPVPVTELYDEDIPF